MKRLIELFRENVKHGEFELASGKISNYYVDGRMVSLTAEGLTLISKEIVDIINSSRIHIGAVGGMSMGADPIVGGVLVEAGHRRQKLSGFLVRKGSKDHGAKKLIEGPLPEMLTLTHHGPHVVEAEPGGINCLIVDDVVTTGGSCLKVVEKVREINCHVIGVIAVCDRLEGAAETFKKEGIPFRSLITIKDVLEK